MPQAHNVGDLAGRPLHGLTLWNTRAASAAPALSERPERLGGRVIAQPTIAFSPPESWESFDAALARLTPETWIVFTSATAVDFACGRVAQIGRGLSPWADNPIAAVGEGTAAALERHGLTAALVPKRFQQEGLLEALAPRLGEKARVWLPQAERTRPLLREGLRAGGATVTATPVYRTVIPPGGLGSALEALLAGQVDWVLFTSSSTVDHLFRMLPGPSAEEALRLGPRIACLGEITAESARGHGLRVAVVPQKQSLDGLVAALAAEAANAADSADSADVGARPDE